MIPDMPADGGGVRGLSELLILEQLMTRLQRKQNLTTPPLPCEIFDMICGTSTGGKVSLFLGVHFHEINCPIV